MINILLLVLIIWLALGLISALLLSLVNWYYSGPLIVKDIMILAVLIPIGPIIVITVIIL